MTYREKIQQMIKDLDSMYDDADYLRDKATQEEKEYWNALRTKLPDCLNILQKLDNSIADNRAAIKLKKKELITFYCVDSFFSVPAWSAAGLVPAACKL